MRMFGLLFMITLSLMISAQKINPSRDSTVHLVSVSQSDEDMKQVVMAGSQGRYILFCNLKALGCISPLPGRPYRIITESTTGKPDLAWIKDWYVSYNPAETVGIFPAWPDWDKNKSHDDRYKMVGAYELSRFTVKGR